MTTCVTTISSYPRDNVSGFMVVFLSALSPIKFLPLSNKEKELKKETGLEYRYDVSKNW